MPKIHHLTFNGTDTRSLGIFVTGSGTYNAAEMDVTNYTIPGRNGDLILFNNRYKNIRVTYPCFVPNSFEPQSIRNWMRSVTTYARIEDDYCPDHYRMGIPVGILEFTPVNRNDAANFQLVFDCKPQRFLTSGETVQGLTDNGSLTNPTQFVSKPLVRVAVTEYGEGTVTIGDTTLSISNDTEDIYIDSETENCYRGAVNKNNTVTFSNGFPVLSPGENPIFIGGDVYRVDITPRWWEL